MNNEFLSNAQGIDLAQIMQALNKGDASLKDARFDCAAGEISISLEIVVKLKKSALTCHDCGAEITDAVDRYGNVRAAKEIVEISKSRFGKLLCCDCIRAKRMNKNGGDN